MDGLFGSAVRFHVASYRNGLDILRSCGAFQEISQVLAGLTTEKVAELRVARQQKSDAAAAKVSGPPRKAGIQDGLNKEIKRVLSADPYRWQPGVAVFDPDAGSRKGFWTMDFRKDFDGLGVGLEVTFNHAEALTWTPIRLSLASEAENARPDARIRCGAIIIATDHLKGVRAAEGLRMDSAVGTYERLRTVLAKIRSVVTVPIGIFALDWANGGQEGKTEEISLHTSGSGLGKQARL